VPLLDTVEFDGVVVGCRVPRPDAALAFQPGVVVAFDIVADPRCWGDVEVGMVAGEVDEDDGDGVFDDWAVYVELPG
jgi:hypothetical protein